MAAVGKHGAPFDVLIVADVDRLGRDSVATPYAIAQLLDAGVRIYAYADDREITLQSSTDTFMLQVQAFVASMEREKARQRTYSAMRRKAEAGHVTGGRVFGYRNVTVTLPDGRRSHVERRIDDGEAAIVREIFARCAEDWGFTRIAKTLNDRGVPSPRPQQGRPSGWVASSIRSVLFRELYRGVIVWNRTQKRDGRGRVKFQRKAASDWLRIDAPALRVVADAEWRAAHARLTTARDAYLCGTNGRLWGRPERGVESKYLLPGISRCGLCGGSLYVKSRSHSGRRAYFYGCTSYHLRGKSVCTNNLEVPMDAVHAKVLEMASEALQPDVIEAAVARAVQLQAEAVKDREAPRKAAEDRIKGLDAEIVRLTNAIALGGELQPLLEALRARQAERERVAATLAVKPVTPGSLATSKKEIRTRLEQWRELLQRQIPQARQILKKLLVGPLLFTPEVATFRTGWKISGQSRLDRLFAGTDFATSVASPTGLRAPWQPTFHGIADRRS